MCRPSRSAGGGGSRQRSSSRTCHRRPRSLPRLRGTARVTTVVGASSRARSLRRSPRRCVTPSPTRSLSDAFDLTGHRASRRCHPGHPDRGPAARLRVLGFFVGRLYLALGAGRRCCWSSCRSSSRARCSRRTCASRSRTTRRCSMLIRALERRTATPPATPNGSRTTRATSARSSTSCRRAWSACGSPALMHDIGKLVVPEPAAQQAGEASPQTSSRRCGCTRRSAVQMLSHIDFLRPIAGAGHSDNMRFDPDDPDHPIEPYIIMVADAYDAMTSTRSYRKALPAGGRVPGAPRQSRASQFHPALRRGAHSRDRATGRGARRRSRGAITLRGRAGHGVGLGRSR